MKGFTPFRTLCLLACLAGGTAAFAQGGHGGGMGGGMGGGRGMGPGGMPRGGGLGMPSPGGNVPRGGSPSEEGRHGSMRAGLQLGPPGRWWDDKRFARSLGLNEDQQKRMDSVFAQNRDLLVSRFENLRRAQSHLDSLTKSGKQTETSLFAEIDHVSQARAELEKANTHYLLQLRDELTPDQLSKLEDAR